VKKVLVGSVGILSSVILFGLTLVSASIYSLYLTNSGGTGGWDTNLGPFWAAVQEIGILPLIICVLLFFGGIYYMVVGIKEQP
jgi:hypothetical protein